MIAYKFCLFTLHWVMSCTGILIAVPGTVILCQYVGVHDGTASTKYFCRFMAVRFPVGRQATSCQLTLINKIYALTTSRPEILYFCYPENIKAGISGGGPHRTHSGIEHRDYSPIILLPLTYRTCNNITKI